MKNSPYASVISKFLTSHRISIIYISLFVGICELFVTWNYYSNNLVSKFSWVPDDTLLNSPTVLGLHDFSDLSSMTAAASSSDPYSAPYFTAYPPVIMFLLKFIAVIFPIKSYLILILLFGLISLWPIWDSAKNHRNFKIYVAFLVSSIPFVAMLDRGNLIGLITVPLYLFFVNLQKKKLVTSAVWLSVAIGIKFYVVIVLLFILARREYRLFIYTSVIVAFTNSLLFCTWGNPLRLFSYFVRNVIASGESVSEVPSLNRVDATASILSLLRITHLDFLPQYNWIVNHSNFFNFSILIVLVLVSRVVLSNYWFFLALFALQLVPDPAYTYCAIWICVGIPLMLIYEDEKMTCTAKNPKNKGSSKDFELERNLFFENIFWRFVLLNGSLIFIYRYNSNFLPTLGFVILLIYLIVSLGNVAREKIHKKSK